MVYKTIEQINGTGMTGLLQTVSDAVPIFPGLILLAIWAILTFGMFFSSVRRTGRGDFVACNAVGWFVAMICSIIMSIIPNFITNVTIIPVIIMTIVSFVFLIISNTD